MFFCDKCFILNNVVDYTDAAYIKQPISIEANSNSRVLNISASGFLLYYFLGDTYVYIWPDSHTRNRIICETRMCNLPQPPNGKYPMIDRYELLFLKKSNFSYSRGFVA